MLTLEKTDIEQRLHLDEDRIPEFKQIRFRGDHPVESQPDVVADKLAKYANTSGGVVSFDVTDEGKVQGKTREPVTKP